MSLISNTKFGCLFSRRLILSSIRIQKPGFFSTSSLFDVRKLSSKPFLKQHEFKYSSRAASTTTKNVEETSKLYDNEKWIPIYRFPGIIFCGFISKLKFAQTIGSALIIPWLTYNYASGYSTFEFVAAGYIASLLAPLTLFAFTRTFNRMIGVISMNEQNDKIRVGYLSFFGTRRNAIIPVEDIIPIADLVSKGDQKVLQLKRYSQPDQWFYIPARAIQILDRERVELLFGTLDGMLEMPMKFGKQIERSKEKVDEADKKLQKAVQEYCKEKSDIENRFKKE